MTTAYWWQGGGKLGEVTNMGDQLGPILLSHFAGIDVEWAPAAEADIICCGSIIDALPESHWDGTVVGCGLLREYAWVDLKAATVLGVRGVLTRDRVVNHHKSVALGDPGILVSELVTRQPISHAVGVVPHWSDTELYPREVARAERGGWPVPYLIDVTGDPIGVISAISSCHKIVASSLHGIIAADAFGLQRRAMPFPKMHSDVEGSSFKWHDYASSIGQPINFGVTQTAPALWVRQLQSEVYEMFQTLGRRHVQAA